LTRSSLCSYNRSATTVLYTLSLHDALPISAPDKFPLSSFVHEAAQKPPSKIYPVSRALCVQAMNLFPRNYTVDVENGRTVVYFRSEEHTSELQSRENLVCRLLLEKKKKKTA